MESSKSPPIDFYRGETAGELAELLELAAEQVPECWALAHNLGFDLAVSSLPVVLAARGWKLKFVNLGDESCVFSLEKDRHKLVLTDSWSWLRCSLAEAAKDVRTHKVKLPANDDDLEAWHKRSKRDVLILDKLLAGSWTGGSTAARHLRHNRAGVRLAGHAHDRAGEVRPRRAGALPHRIRAAGDIGGRKEVYRVGTITEAG